MKPTPRQPEHSADRLFVDRWSPRSLLPEPIPEADLLVLLEAARWAPSSYNNQPWRILYARRETAAWPAFFDLLVEANKGWAKDAAALLLFVSHRFFEHNGKPCPTHSFDTGAAWENLALQAAAKGYVAHGMQGFDAEKARAVLEVPEGFAVEVMVAVGRQGPKEALPEELQKREEPNGRRPLAATAAEGKFTAALLPKKD
ncbi:MAG: nitroreductase family protein [Verrucomicrobium sp.]|nr:nitroreductase family protein [Verrucomicrobium sp.]